MSPTPAPTGPAAPLFVSLACASADVEAVIATVRTLHSQAVHENPAAALVIRETLGALRREADRLAELSAVLGEPNPRTAARSAVLGESRP